MWRFVKRHYRWLIPVASVAGIAIACIFSPEWRHTMGRQVEVHIGAALLIQKVAYHALRYLQRRLRGRVSSRWFTTDDRPPMLISGFVPFGIALWREPLDLAAGGWLPKTYVDWGVWLACGLIGAYETYRTKHKD